MIFRRLSPKTTLSCGILWLWLLVAVRSDDSLNFISDCELEKLLKSVFIPPDDNSIQAQALRQRLVNILRQSLTGEQQQFDENELNEKRSLSSLARWNNLPAFKRNVQALARGGYLTNQRENNDEVDDRREDPNYKRNSYYENREQQRAEENDDVLRKESKRGIQSLARNGELRNSRQQIAELLDELYEKRNIGSLARDFNFPTYGKRFVGSLARSGDLRTLGVKRNIASIVRNGRGAASFEYPEYDNEYKRNLASLARNGDRLGKRNMAALLRQDDYLNRKREHETEVDTEKPLQHEDDDNKQENKFDEMEVKRNIASVKSGGYKSKYKRSAPFFATYSDNSRTKRQADYYDDISEEYLQPVYQSNYDDFTNELSDMYPNAEKRFLGSVARSGWPSSLVKYHNYDKRHIGSLARLGWLPTLRSIRRFNRSGRSSNVGEVEVCRETSSNGKNQNDSFSKGSPDDKRVFLISAVDNARPRRFPMAPRNY